MSEPYKIVNTASAADTSVGFEYQFYYFFLLMLDLRHGEKIGLEVKDDIHIELPNGGICLIQTKHTVQQKVNGEAINLVERDKDLWKTLSNWVNIINQQTDKRGFITNTTFRLVSNKSTSHNPFLQKLLLVAEEEMSIADFKVYLTNLIDTTRDSTCIGYMKSFKALATPIMLAFIKNIKFDLNEDDLIIRIKQRLIEQIRIAERVEDVYASLQSTIRDQIYHMIKHGERIEVSFQDFQRRFAHCFKKGFTESLPIRELEFTLPDNVLNQKFIRQLLDIKAMSEFDKEEIIEMTTYMLMIYNNLEKWKKDGDLGSSDAEKFEANTVLQWKNSFSSKYREIKKRQGLGAEIEDLEDDIQDAAVKCLDELKMAILIVDETSLDLRMSNGYFYLLTEEGNIGWHLDWVNRY